MPKKKRTLKQKMQADKRQVAPTALHSSSVETSTHYTLDHLSLPKNRPQISSAHTGVISTSDYTYLAPDLRKTFFITLAVVLIELFIRYFALGN